jgi:hypothetical protein
LFEAFSEVKRLTQKEVLLYQERGCFDEHLVALNTQAFGDPYIYQNAYLVYHDPLSKTLWLTLFELNECKTPIDKYDCLKTTIAKFNPRKIKFTSPEKLKPTIGDYRCESTFFDKDYQIRLEEFDENLRGGNYQNLRSRVNNAIRRGYRFSVSKEITHTHSYLMVSHISKREYQPWDLQLFLRLQNFVEKSKTARLLNVFLDDMLIGFDVVDFMGKIMAVPLGFYLDYPSLTDFMMLKEISYAKEQKYEWLDIGWACSPGVEEFKKKWKGIARYNIYVQEYSLLDKEKNKKK